jgi:hypothetical protein
VPGGPSRRRSGRSHEASGDGRPRGMAVAVSASPLGGRGAVQNPAYAPSGIAPSPHGAAWAARHGRGSHLGVDDLAHQTGITTFCWGKPCGSTIARLPRGRVRLSSNGCGRKAAPCGCRPAIAGEFAGDIAEPTRHTRGTGRAISGPGSPAPFLIASSISVRGGRRSQPSLAQRVNLLANVPIFMAFFCQGFLNRRA